MTRFTLPKLFLMLVCCCLWLSASDEGYTAMLLDHGEWKVVPPDSFNRAKKGKQVRVLKRKTITYNIVYEDDGTGLGFDDPNEGQARKDSFEAVLAYISTVIGDVGELDIVVTESLNDSQSGTLASAAPLTPIPNNPSLQPGFHRSSAQIHLQQGTDPLPSNEDIQVTVNFGSSYYTGTGTVPNGQFDLFTVLLHEMTHGLGFASVSTADGSGGFTDLPNTFTSFDNLLYANDGTKLWDDSGVFQVSTNVLTSNAVDYRGSNGTVSYGSFPPIHSPAPFNLGSSMGHWGASVSESVMVSALASGVAKRAYAEVDLAALADLGYAIAQDTVLVYPWVSNSDDFESTIVLNNFGTVDANLTFTGRRANGDVETVTDIVVPARGFFQSTASDLFTLLGRGGGYTVTAVSDVNSVRGRWVTNDRPGETPSQGIAIRATSATTARAGTSIMLGYLPGNANFQSAPVLTNLGDSNTDITVYFFDEAGNRTNTLNFTDVAPLTPVVVTVVGAGDGDQSAVAVSNGTNITGVGFVFNGVNQTAIGNGTAILNFVEP